MKCCVLSPSPALPASVEPDILLLRLIPRTRSRLGTLPLYQHRAMAVCAASRPVRLVFFEIWQPGDLIMKKVAFSAIVLGATMVAPLLYSAPAHAQATRTWVSGVGDDLNP